MKTLLLLRHGKAVADDPAGDHARALAQRGREQAEEVAGVLHRLGLDPDLVIVSDARRTQETAEAVFTNLGSKPATRLEPKLYEASPNTILSVIADAGGAAQHLMVVGHNPGLGEAARKLSGSGEPQAQIALGGSFPTCALATIEFPVERWSEVAFGAGLLTHFVVPEA
jgi:phosphohistidine phosphatase